MLIETFIPSIRGFSHKSGAEILSHSSSSRPASEVWHHPVLNTDVRGTLAWDGTGAPSWHRWDVRHVGVAKQGTKVPGGLAGGNYNG
jgi:hypothetical protein